MTPSILSLDEITVDGGIVRLLPDPEANAGRQS
jgi:hypothetical protein